MDRNPQKGDYLYYNSGTTQGVFKVDEVQVDARSITRRIIGDWLSHSAKRFEIGLTWSYNSAYFELAADSQIKHMDKCLKEGKWIDRRTKEPKEKKEKRAPGTFPVFN